MKRITYLALGALFMVVFFAAFTGCTIEVDDPQPTLVVTLEPQTTYTGGHFEFLVYADGSGPSTGEESLAAGGAPIREDGSLDWDAIARIWGTGIIWRPVFGEEYDVYPYLDLNFSGEYEEWYDLDYSGHLDVTITSAGENLVSVSEDDFVVKPQPSPAGVYSGTYPPNIEPSWYRDNTNTMVDFQNQEKTVYDGMYALKLVYNEAGSVKAQFQSNPPMMDVSASSKIVLYIENTAAGFDRITLTVWDADNKMASVDIGPVTGVTYKTDADVGPGDNWDEYEIPFSDFPGIDWTRLSGVSLDSPIHTGDVLYTQPLYFDNIHFAP